MGGYAYVFSDSQPGTGMSTACISSAALCGKGTTGVLSAATWGAGFGVNVHQLQAATTKGIYTPTGTAGLSYALSAVPTGTLYLMVDNGGTDYYAAVTAASGTIPWATFKTTPWMADASAPLSGPPSMTHAQFQLSAGTLAGSFDFCVTKLAFM